MGATEIGVAVDERERGDFEACMLQCVYNVEYFRSRVRVDGNMESTVRSDRSWPFYAPWTSVSEVCFTKLPRCFGHSFRILDAIPFLSFNRVS